MCHAYCELSHLKQANCVYAVPATVRYKIILKQISPLIGIAVTYFIARSYGVISVIVWP